MSKYNGKIAILQKENKQLRKALETKHYCKYANRCNEVYDCTREEYNSMAECNMELWLKNDELQQENKQLKEELESKKKMYWQRQCAYYSSILYSLEEWLKIRIRNVPETMAEVYEDKTILDKIQELKEKYSLGDKE